MKVERGQVAVITGAASGIGYGIAESFAQRGLDIVLADVEADLLGAAVSSIEAKGVSAIGQRIDVRDPAQIDALAKATLDRFGRVDIVCNNAGVVSPQRSMWEIERNDWEWVLSVNLWGVINGIRSFVPHLVAQNSGHVVNTASMLGISIVPRFGPYTASKYAVVGLSELLAAELADAAPNVGVTVLCPGQIATNIWEAERNRPADLAVAPAVVSTQRAPVTAGALSASTGMDPMSPSAVGDIVVAAVESNTLHIAPNGSIAGVRARIDRLLADLADLP